MRIKVVNRGPDAAPIHIIPQLWARNTWAWRKGSRRPLLSAEGHGVSAVHPRLRDMRLDCDAETPFVFCENETNIRRLYGMDGTSDPSRTASTTSSSTTTRPPSAPPPRAPNAAPPSSASSHPAAKPKSASASAPPNATATPSSSSTPSSKPAAKKPNEFYAALQKDIHDPDARLVQRQALAGMLWSKQFFLFDVRRWLDGDPAQPKPPASRTRNHDWRHLNNADVISMPDKWEYPWYAAWDLAFHCTTFALIDPEFAKDQLLLMLREWYMHPNGQIPAYEWAFGDVNPPVHAWAAWRVFEMDRHLTGTPDHAFLERVFHKLMLNFTWWVNRKDADGRNVFQGGFLGLDNIGVFDRSAPLPTGGTMDQADGTAWMAMYTLNLLRIALELAGQNRVYEDTATKFFEHFLYIAEAMAGLGGEGGLWDDEDGFFYDALRLPDGSVARMRVRSMVGLIPLMAVEVIGADVIDSLPDFASRLRWFLGYRPDLAGLISRWAEPGAGERRLLSLLRGHRMNALLSRMLDENEFLSPYGVRSLSKAHHDATPSTSNTVSRPTPSPTPPAKAQPASSAATQTGADPSGSPSTPSSSNPSAASTTTTAKTSSSNAPPAPARCEPSPAPPTKSASASSNYSSKTPKASAPPWSKPAKPPGPAKKPSNSTNSSTATPAKASEPPTKPDGPASSPSSSKTTPP